MTKKPASLTSQLLVRKGDATPAAVPEAEQTEQTAATAPANEPETSADSASAADSAESATPETSHTPDPVFAATPNGMQPAQEPTEEQEPVRPEPEIVMEPAPEKKPSHLKTYIGVLVILIMGVVVALDFLGADRSGDSIAPLASSQGEASDAPKSNDTTGPAPIDTEKASTAKTLTPYTDAARGKVAAQIEPSDPAIDDAIKSLALRSSNTPAAPVERPETTDRSSSSSVAPVTYNKGTVEVPTSKAPAKDVVPVQKPASVAPAAKVAKTETTKADVAKATPPAAASIAKPAATISKPAQTARIAQKGQYLIQLFSVRSQKDAQRGWTKTQAKHSALLSQETLNLEKADLGERGIYYRVRFGAYDTSAAANSVCAALKKAKQDCLVKKLR